MELSWKEKRGAFIVRIKGRLDITEADNFEKSLISRLQEEPRNFIVNLSGISYMSSSGIRALLAIYRYGKSCDLRMVVCEVSPVVQKVLDVVDLGQVFQVFENEDGALQSFQAVT